MLGNRLMASSDVVRILLQGTILVGEWYDLNTYQFTFYGVAPSNPITAYGGFGSVQTLPIALYSYGGPSFVYHAPTNATYLDGYSTTGNGLFNNTITPIYVSVNNGPKQQMTGPASQPVYPDGAQAGTYGYSAPGDIFNLTGLYNTTISLVITDS